MGKLWLYIKGQKRRNIISLRLACLCGKKALNKIKTSAHYLKKFPYISFLDFMGQNFPYVTGEFMVILKKKLETNLNFHFDISDGHKIPTTSPSHITVDHVGVRHVGN